MCLVRWADYVLPQMEVHTRPDRTIVLYLGSIYCLGRLRPADRAFAVLVFEFVCESPRGRSCIFILYISISMCAGLSHLPGNSRRALRGRMSPYASYIRAAATILA